MSKPKTKRPITAKLNIVTEQLEEKGFLPADIIRMRSAYILGAMSMFETLSEKVDVLMIQKDILKLYEEESSKKPE